MSGGADVVCQGWLRKSPPEKKLRRYAWKRRWFVLRSGRLTGDPDVLEYYKHDHARKPIRIINMSLCEQVDAGLTFNKKDLNSSYVFDVRTLDRVFYLVAESEEDMNRWVRSICDLCGFNPTDSERPAVAAQSTVVNVTTGHAPVTTATSTITALHPYESVSSQEDGGTEYLWLSHCQSKTLQRPPVGSTSSDTTDNSDNSLLSHRAPQSSSSSLANGQPSLPHPHTATWAVAKEYHFNHSQDSVANPDLQRGWTRGFASPHPRKHSLQLQAVSLPSMCNDVVFTTGGATTANTQLNGSNGNSSYQVPRASSVSSAGSEPPGQGDSSSTPPPRPPKPLASAPAESSSPGVVSALVPQTTSEPDWSLGGRGGDRGGDRGGRGPSCGSVTSPDCCQAASQERCSVSRPVSEQARPSMFDFTDSFNSYFMNKGVVPLSGQTRDEDVEENYIPMSASNLSLASLSSLPTSLPESPPQDTNYVSMTPCPGELPALGRQVPPPAHLVFRSSPIALHTPPIRRHTTGGGMGRGACDSKPPPIHRNLKPRKDKPAPLDITPLQEWEELPAPVRSPVTRTFTRDPSSCSQCPLGRPSSCPSSASSSDSEEPDDNYVAMTTSSLAPPAVESNPRDDSSMVLRRDDSPMVLRHDISPMVLRHDISPMVLRHDISPMVLRHDISPMVLRHDISPMVLRHDISSMVLRRDDSPMVLRRPRRDKQVEYLDLDLHTGRVATPPRQKKSVLGNSMGSSDGEHLRARVEYVVVDPERTRALKSTREAWHGGRQLIEKEK